MNARGQGGFALLALLLLLGVSGVVAVAALERVVRPDTEQAVTTSQRLAAVAATARQVFRASGAFPTRLDNVAAAAQLDAAGAWRADPWRPGSTSTIACAAATSRCAAPVLTGGSTPPTT